MTGRALRCQPALVRFETGAHEAGMTDGEKSREERLAAALRENLKRRKAQARVAADSAAKDQPD
jgi:hypothetical protein